MFWEFTMILIYNIHKLKRNINGTTQHLKDY
jgi:hypothetical protein